MQPKIVAYCQATIDAEGSITSTSAYNCQITDAGVGDFNITLGEAGVDSGSMMPVVTPVSGAAGGAGTAVNATVHSTNDTTVRVRFFDDAGVAVDPPGFLFEAKRYPNLPVT